MNNTIFVPGTEQSWLGDTFIVDPFIAGASGQPNTRSGYRTRKYFSDVLQCQQGQCFINFPVMRYAEVLLNLAEALYERDGSISDADLDRTINMLRDRVGVTHLSNILVSGNGLDMRAEIRRERTVELAYEGFRFDDLRRWKEAENLLPVDLLGVKFVGTEFETTEPNNVYTAGVDLDVNPDGFVIVDPAGNRNWEDKNYLSPLPLDELQINPNLGQNPGW